MPWSVKIFLTVLIGFTIGIFIFIFHPHHEGDETSQAPIQEVVTPLAEGLMLALVIDTNEHIGVHYDHVVTGDDSMLIYIPSGTNPNDETAQKFFSFNELSSLLMHDRDGSGYIDSNDPIYGDMYVAKLNHSAKTLTYQSVARAGVAAIIFNPEFLIAESGEQAQRFEKVAGDVVMSDNSRWHLRVLPLDISHFRELRLINLDKEQTNQ